MRWTGIVLRVLLGLLFAGSVIIGMFAGGTDDMARELRLESWFLVVVSVVELVGGLGLLASLWFPRLALPSGLLFVAIMSGAVVAHIRVDDPVANMILPAVILLLAAVISAIAFWEDLELRSSLASRIAVAPEYVDRRQSNV